MPKLYWWIATGLWILTAVPAAAFAALSVMVFDAPGSTDSRLTVALFASTLAFPVFCLLGAGLPWLFRSKTFGKWLFLIPLLDLAAIAIIAASIERWCGGSFVCK